MTYAELRVLLLDCLKLWEVVGKIVADDTGLLIETAGGVFHVAAAEPDHHPVRWLYQTPERFAAGRPPRAAASIVGLLSALRNAMEGKGGDRLRVEGAV
jgi:hypothetical protein